MPCSKRIETKFPCFSRIWRSICLNRMLCIKRIETPLLKSQCWELFLSLNRMPCSKRIQAWRITRRLIDKVDLIADLN